jgi:hypothetical protein
VRHLAQDFIAGGVTEEIIDRLEAVDVGDADGKGAGSSARSDASLRILSISRRRLPKSGQRVGVGHGVGILVTTRPDCRLQAPLTKTGLGQK